MHFFQENGTGILAILGVLATLWTVFSVAINQVVGPKFDSLTERLSKIEMQLATLNDRFNTVDVQLADLDLKLETINQTLKNQKLKRLHGKRKKKKLRGAQNGTTNNRGLRTKDTE